ncbi:hypothetical protein [Aestuariivirga sp.]|uniref:hypothetical protein n=1 Tax=Aestuariivirga sp. TaxID=2650926 RepID=UPI00391C6476
MLLAFLVPMLLAVLPQPVSSLERDLAFSVCGSETEPGAPGHASAGHDHCILCSAGCPHSGPAPAEPFPAFAPPATAPCAAARNTARIGIPLPLRALLDAIPPRGPPASPLA